MLREQRGHRTPVSAAFCHFFPFPSHRQGPDDTGPRWEGRGGGGSSQGGAFSETAPPRGWEVHLLRLEAPPYSAEPHVAVPRSSGVRVYSKLTAPGSQRLRPPPEPAPPPPNASSKIQLRTVRALPNPEPLKCGLHVTAGSQARALRDCGVTTLTQEFFPPSPGALGLGSVTGFSRIRAPLDPI